MMSRGVNKVILIGNVGQDPELKYMPNGNAVVNISVATSESWKDKNTGQQQEKTEWHKIVAFSRLAEVIGEYLHKGSKVYIEGSLRTNKWQDQSGQDRYSTEIIANNMQMLDGKQEGGQQQARAAQDNGFSQPPPQAQPSGAGGGQAAPQQQSPQQTQASGTGGQQFQQTAPATTNTQQAQQKQSQTQDFEDDIPW